MTSLSVGGGGQELDPDTSGRLTSFSFEGEEAGHFREVAGVSTVDVGGLCSWYTL